ncbi:TetR/AcrR family transcriptional regulator [Companilactobacillus sp.]|jgi:AcrR family transcriptional regulator|uniref:TetR/AcrR family transcriptional regulator n=1 Tax=Companilactobacillus sp. TaxID=2767905 RepID=UPI0025C22A1E|nr:TetR/AcrR family transcriptional regulator [Companilactobacillus sp.]MCH4008885.1 TetR/AcrR family transcriptional regulator [Companilactobacillus sp.]MCH4050936.1 TetR/AcrR family transcriptional regulator [Companilactobacillus sp.]MCH4076828.1 TetR/AcrR family transcriptional regulator [Companilactobacillus sp.]MCH4125403.1 TetR/AcrR family transcriptional regulator [Companilactobacillus sp.]MCH4131945.1 TetR/AcrR family transcriptional regulator [Companilactobacillus sp.]
MAATNHAQAIKKDSQQYLTTALFQLLETKPLNEISVTQVVKRAGVSRMAFYRNFDTLDDLLTSYFEPQIEQKFTDIKNDISTQDKMDSLGQFFTQMADTMVLADKSGFEYIIQNIFNDQMRDFYESYIPTNNISDVSRKYWIQFMSAGVYAIWREWLLGGQQESLTTIHDILARFQNSTMKSLITIQ